MNIDNRLSSVFFFLATVPLSKTSLIWLNFSQIINNPHQGSHLWTWLWSVNTDRSDCPTPPGPLITSSSHPCPMRAAFDSFFSHSPHTLLWSRLALVSLWLCPSFFIISLVHIACICLFLSTQSSLLSSFYEVFFICKVGLLIKTGLSMLYKVAVWYMLVLHDQKTTVRTTALESSKSQSETCHPVDFCWWTNDQN